MDNQLAQLEKTRASANMNQQMAEKHNQERQELERRAQELADRQAKEQQQAQQMNQQQAQFQRDIEIRTQNLIGNQDQLRQAKNFVQQQTEERRTIETQTKQNLTNEAEAKRKAEELARRLELISAIHSIKKSLWGKNLLHEFAKIYYMFSHITKNKKKDCFLPMRFHLWYNIEETHCKLAIKDVNNTWTRTDMLHY